MPRQQRSFQENVEHVQRNLAPNEARPAKEDPFADWYRRLVNAIKQTIDAQKAEGTVQMSIDNLRQLVRVPDGGPRGTNVQMLYKTEFFPKAVSMLTGSYRMFVRK